MLAPEWANHAPSDWFPLALPKRFDRWRFEGQGPGAEAGLRAAPPRRAAAGPPRGERALGEGPEGGLGIRRARKMDGIFLF